MIYLLIWCSSIVSLDEESSVGQGSDTGSDYLKDNDDEEYTDVVDESVNLHTKGLYEAGSDYESQYYGDYGYAE